MILSRDNQAAINQFLNEATSIKAKNIDVQLEFVRATWQPNQRTKVRAYIENNGRLAHKGVSDTKISSAKGVMAVRGSNDAG